MLMVEKRCNTPILCLLHENCVSTVPEVSISWHCVDAGSKMVCFQPYRNFNSSNKNAYVSFNEWHVNLSL